MFECVARWCSVAIMAACFQVPGALAGPKPGDTYKSPLGNFTIIVPDYALGTKVEKSNDKTRGFVSFTGGTGQVGRIGYQRFDAPPPPPDANMIGELNHLATAALDSSSLETLQGIVANLDSLSRDALLVNLDEQLPGMHIGAERQPQAADTTIFALAALAFVQIASAQEQLLSRYEARVVSREPVVLDAMLTAFTVAVSPEASSNVNMATGKPLDVTFGHLVFIKHGFLYNLVAQPSGFASGSEQELAENSRRLLEELYRAMVFH